MTKILGYAIPTTVFNVEDHDSKWTMYPNPTASDILIRISPRSREVRRIQLVTAQGVLIEERVLEPLEKGTTIRRLDTARLLDGVYLVAIWFGKIREVKKILILH